MKTIYKITMATIAAVAMTFTFSETSAQNRSGYRGGSSSNSSSVSRSNNSSVSRSNSSSASTKQQISTERGRVTDSKRETSSTINNRGNQNKNNNKNNNNSTGVKSIGTTTRPTGNNGGSSSRPTGSSSTGSNVRPDEHGNRPGSGAGTRPNGGSNSGSNVRPDNHGNRPGSGAGTRPNVNHGNSVRPGHNHHQNDHYHHNGCGNPNHHFHPTPPPHRPHRPVAHCCHRPVFPTNYRPYAYAPTINAIFGLRFGFSLGYSIDILANNGYVIDGYTNSEIYLRNVRNSGYQWDDAIIYYDDYGNMAGVSFYDSTTRYSTRRYDAVYAHLCNIYGRPAIINNYQGSLSASWWDGSGRSYITLSLGYGNAFGGSSRYYTTLSFGNNY